MMADQIQWLLHSATAHLDEARVAMLVVLLMLAAAIDVWQMRVPNWVTIPGAAIGLALSVAIPWQELGGRWAIDGALWSLGGLAAGVLVLLPLYALRVMGAGDVKLMGMVGSYVGLQQVVPTVLCVFIAGGLAATVFVLWRRSAWRASANVAQIVRSSVLPILSGIRPVIEPNAWTSVGKLPYGVSICLGTLTWVTVKQLA